MAKSLLLTPGPTHAPDPAVNFKSNATEISKAMLQRYHKSNIGDICIAVTQYEQSKMFNAKFKHDENA